MTSTSEEKDNLKKIARKHKPNKLYLRSFLEKYQEVFEPVRNESLKVLEIGVGGYKNPQKGGGSLRMWSEYFENSRIVGVDLNEKELDLPDNVVFCQGSQTDISFLVKLVRRYGPFDIVIDDASHITENTIITFNALWDHTKLFYIIEDLHMKKAAGTEEYFGQIKGADFSTKHMCVITK